MTLGRSQLLSIVALSVFGVLMTVYAAALQATQAERYPDTFNVSNIACTQEAKLCPDGSFVSRTGPNCEFAPCPQYGNPSVIGPTPGEENCTDVVRECSNGTVITNSCQSCPEDPGYLGPPEAEPGFCTAEVKRCANGKFVGRDPGNNCKFKLCNEEIESSKTYAQLHEQRKACRADYDRSWQIDVRDLSQFALNYGETLSDCSLDIVGDNCELNVNDLAEFAAYYRDEVACRL